MQSHKPQCSDLYLIYKTKRVQAKKFIFTNHTFEEHFLKWHNYIGGPSIQRIEVKKKKEKEKEKSNIITNCSQSSQEDFILGKKAWQSTFLTRELDKAWFANWFINKNGTSDWLWNVDEVQTQTSTITFRKWSECVFWCATKSNT